MNDTYGRLTGRKRWIIVIIGAVLGIVVDLLFAWFGSHPVDPGDLILAAVVGSLLGLSASLGEKRRRKT